MKGRRGGMKEGAKVNLLFFFLSYFNNAPATSSIFDNETDQL